MRARKFQVQNQIATSVSVQRTRSRTLPRNCASYWRRSSASDSQHDQISKCGAQLATLWFNV